MAGVADRIKESTTTTGTGTITLAGAATGFRAFSSEFADATTPEYAIIGPTGEWETGIGTMGGSGTTLARTTVVRSSNANAAVNFSAGTKSVFNDQLATEILYGPSSSVDNALARYDGPTGKRLQGYTSGAPTVDDTGNLTINGTLSLSTDVVLERDAADFLAQRHGATAQTFRLYSTFTDSGNYARLVLSSVTSPANTHTITAESAGTGSANQAIRLLTKGGGRFTVSNTTQTSGVFIEAAAKTGEFSLDTSGNLVFRASTGGAGVYFDAGTTINFRTASGGTHLWQITSGGHWLGMTDNAYDVGDATHRPRNLYLGTALVSDATTGIKIGTATTQKIGFFNATPVVQGASVADATDATTVITQLNALISRLEALGLIATV